MQYALMIYAEPGYDEALPDGERKAAHAEYSALAEDARYVSGAQLQPAETATCVRVVSGRTLMTDGPFADTKEVLGGLCLALRYFALDGTDHPTHKEQARHDSALHRLAEPPQRQPPTP